MKTKDFQKIIKGRIGKKPNKVERKQASAFHLKFAQAFYHSWMKDENGEPNGKELLKKYGTEPTQEQIDQYNKSMAIMQPGQLYPTKLQKRLDRYKRKFLKATKRMALVLFLATNICVAQKKIAIVITGYDNIQDSFRVCNVNFVDTSFWIINEPLLGNNTDTLWYGEINPWDKSEYEICQSYIFTDFYGAQTPLALISHDILLVITRQKLISLGKL